LVAEPNTLAGTRLFKAGNPAEHPAVRRFHESIRSLHGRRPNTHLGGDEHELDTRAIDMTREAAALWIEFYNEIEVAQAPGGALQGAQAFASKAAEHAARIAGVITVVEDPQAAAISGDTMAGAIEVVSFYMSEHVRLTGTGIADHRAGLLRSLAGWIEERGRVGHKALLQCAPRSVRVLKAEGINQLLDELVRRGYIRRAGDTWEARP
jgi:hypothetical protein